MTLISLFSSLAAFVRVRSLTQNAVIDNVVFRCHYKVTSAILLFCCIAVTSRTLIGEAITCMHSAAVPSDVMTSYCWIQGTFTLPHELRKGTLRSGPPGLGPYVEYEQPTRYASYYQWVPIVLFFQGILFYLPHWIWKNWEDGKVEKISDGMRGAVIGSIENRREKVGHLVQYVMDTKHEHNLYAAGFFFCEVLNFSNVVGNIFFVDKFMGGAFLTYGTDVIRFSNLNQENRTDPMVALFPKMTKCSFHNYGASGSVQNIDALCILAVNVWNEKIYVFLWFWLIILAVLSGLGLLYSLAAILSPSVRKLVLRRRFRGGAQPELTALFQHTQIGDFMLLNMLSRNVTAVLYEEFLLEMCRKICNEKKFRKTSTEMLPYFSSEKNI